MSPYFLTGVVLVGQRATFFRYSLIAKNSDHLVSLWRLAVFSSIRIDRARFGRTFVWCHLLVVYETRSSSLMMRRHDFSLPTLVKSWALIHKISPVATFILTPTRKKKENTYCIKDHCNVFVETDKPKGFISRLLLLDYNIDVVRKGLLWCLCLENFYLQKNIVTK